MNRTIFVSALASLTLSCSLTFDADELTARHAVIAEGAVGPLIWHGDKCLDARGCGGTPGQLQLCDCEPGAAHQRWTLASDDTLRALDRCVTALKPQSDAGSRLALVDCDSSKSHWMAFGDHLLNVEEAKCIDVQGGMKADGTAAQLWACRDPNPNQQWDVPSRNTKHGILGPNTFLFEPSMPREQLQRRVSAVYALQQDSEFGSQRFALLFKPGVYTVDILLGFHTQIAGLGMSPGDVTIRGSVAVESLGNDVKATGTFLRAAENLTVEPDETSLPWAAARGTSYRRMHLRGGLRLEHGDQASGGFIADSVIDGPIRSTVQQQWLTRNSSWGEWTGGRWSMVFVGNAQAPTEDNASYSVIETTPVIREKPFLVVDDAGEFRVVVPELRRESAGPSWSDDSPPEHSLPLDDFAVLQPSADTDNAREINEALDTGKHILLTPGVYFFEDTVRVTGNDRIVLGLGMATLISRDGAPALTVDDAAHGVKLAGLLFDASTAHTPVMVQIGSPDSKIDHAQNPSSLHDIYFRAGGIEETDVGASLQIHSSHTIADNLWAWRADRLPATNKGKIGWDVNRAETGVIITGDDVTVYGLSVEHYQNYQTLWSGDRGQIFHYMSELPPDVGAESNWVNGDRQGYATYKVADSVTQHRALGLAGYCFSYPVYEHTVDRAFEIPERDGIELHIVAVSFDGKCKIQHALNDRSESATAPSVAARVKFP